MRAKMPGGYAVWPAFWLVGLQRGETSAEIDIVEYYGRRPDIYMSSSHVWRQSAQPTSVTRPTTAPWKGALEEGFHTNGVLIPPAKPRFYLDRHFRWQTKTHNLR